MKSRKDSADKGAGSGCMARLVRLLHLRGRTGRRNYRFERLRLSSDGRSASDYCSGSACKPQGRSSAQCKTLRNHQTSVPDGKSPWINASNTTPTMKRTIVRMLVALPPSVAIVEGIPWLLQPILAPQDPTAPMWLRLMLLPLFLPLAVLLGMAFARMEYRMCSSGSEICLPNVESSYA
jgi:hypothetical protein